MPDSDRLDKAEGMEGSISMKEKGEATLPKIKLWKKIVLISLGLVLAVCLPYSVFIWKIGPWEGIEPPWEHTPNAVPCKMCLEEINVDMKQYHHKTGIWPENTEFLIPDYLEEIPECEKGGSYYLDTSQTPPLVVCPWHGTTDNFRLKPGKWEWGGRWINKWLITMLIFLALSIAYGVYLLKKKPFSRT